MINNPTRLSLNEDGQLSPRRANPELADRRRDALVRAGYAEILDKGIQGTTLDSVVARAGSSKGGALYYFPDRKSTRLNSSH